MDQLNSTTQHQKGKHLSFKERVIIQTRLNDKHSPNKIAAELGCSPNTIRNEIKRGTVYLYNGKVTRYKAEAGQKAYEKNRANSCRRCEYINKLEFIAHIENNFFELGISIDACVGEAMEKGNFPREQMLCTKTPDKGSKFTELSNLEKDDKTLVYYAHPYSSWEKGSNERHNHLVRRFIAKGERLSDYGIDAIARIED